MNHLVAAYGGGGVPGTPYRSTVTDCSLLMGCLLHGEPIFEQSSELPATQISEIVSTHIALGLVELVADVEGVEGCDWPRYEVPPVGVARSRRDGLSLIASS
jgi:hypothetical protein